MIYILWYLSGFVGLYLCWLVNEHLERWFVTRGRHKTVYCPTPIAILVYILGSVLGPCWLIAALLIAVVDFGIKVVENGLPEWWHKPICKGK